MDLNNWSLYEATAISHDGLTIVGYGKNPNGSTEAWIVTLPEPVIEADIDLDPDTLNLTSKGKWITSYIRLPQDYDVADVNSTSIMIEDEIKATQIWVDEDEQFIMAKFPRSQLQQLLIELDLLGEVELLVSGELVDGTRFEGTATLRVIGKSGKNNSVL